MPLAPDLTARLPGPELMDADSGVGDAELEEALAALRVINRRLGGYRTTRRGLDDLAARTDLAARSRVRPVEVLDIGGGSGDVAEEILAWGRERGIALTVTVMDIDARTAALAASRLLAVAGASARQGDLFAVPPRSYDVVHAALFLHHFDGEEAVHALRHMGRVARVGVVVNDLHRHVVPWVLIRVLTLLFTNNRLVRYDGPLSVARAFSPGSSPASYPSRV